MTLLYTVSWIVSNISDFNNDQLTKILLNGKEDLDNINNTSIMNATINYLIETKRFDAQFSWFSLDVMTLTLTLHLKFIFLIFLLFCLYYLYLFIMFRLIFYFICIFLVTSYIKTYICIPCNCNFLHLMCRC